MTRNLLIKPAGGSCNLHCDYCFYMDEMDHRETAYYGMMSMDTIQAIIKKSVLNAKEPVTFAFQGGEPTLRGIDFFKAVIRYQKQYNHNHIQISNAIQTNGSNLNDAWCKFFSAHNFLVGISVDGTKQDHNRYRHTSDMQDSFDLIREKINLLEKYHVEYNILTVLTKQTAENISDIYQYYKSQGWNYQQYIPCLDPYEAEHGLMPWSLTPDTYGKMLVELFQLFYQDWKEGKQPYIRQFENWIGILLGYAPEACDQRGICGKQYSIEANGDVYPCDFFMMDEYKLGNINHNSWKELDLKRIEQLFIERSEKHSTQCKTCQYYQICRNGCQRMRESIPTDDTYQNYFCESYQYFFDHCLTQLKEMVRSVRP